MTIAQHALKIALLLSMPPLLCGLAIGLIVGAFQAATQINETTLSFIPKMVGVAAILMLAGPWMLRQIVSYTQELFASIPSLIG